ncbi:uncharacterized protein LOC106533545 [Austrofundulus limnaeus]|uniref:Uncharacterized protein LOC106533545 n=1 Tax=Austrofundulus limnaeus TaxID=52670 RepID=A0A2I4CZE2_AUSLI|nr:PREDICTED: uncharacterized protein LOC106533545 [Austrofundulus limnaeus]
MSECVFYGMPIPNVVLSIMNLNHIVTFHDPISREDTLRLVRHLSFPANATEGNFKDVWWICGNKAYVFLPYRWVGCCYMASLTLPYEVAVIQRGEKPDEVHPTPLSGERVKRAVAQFHTLESYHWRISLGEKWGIGLFPHYGVTFLADHIDNLTYTLQAFANETIKGFQFLTDTQRSHRLTLLKHDMALDYILAKQGGLCVALNLTEDACYTLIPDSSDNLTSVIDALKVLRDAFGASEDSGWSAMAWLEGRFGSFGAMIVQGVVAVALALLVMVCCCTVMLTCAKALILKWVGVVVLGGQVQMPLLRGDVSDEEEEFEVHQEILEMYPY